MWDLLARRLLQLRRGALNTYDRLWMTHRATRP
jgi:hypothetical protein